MNVCLILNGNIFVSYTQTLLLYSKPSLIVIPCHVKMSWKQLLYCDTKENLPTCVTNVRCLSVVKIHGWLSLKRWEFASEGRTWVIVHFWAHHLSLSQRGVTRRNLSKRWNDRDCNALILGTKKCHCPCESLTLPWTMARGWNCSTFPHFLKLLLIEQFF